MVLCPQNYVSKTCKQKNKVTRAVRNGAVWDTSHFPREYQLMSNMILARLLGSCKSP